MDILDMLLGNSDLGEALSKNLGAKPEQVQKATTMMIPSLVAGLSKNASDEKGLSSLFEALSDHENKDISNVNNFLDGIDLSDGQKILGHIFGNKTKTVEKEVAKESGLSQVNVSKLMMMLAPLVMAYLGSQKKEKSGFNPTDLVSALGGGSKSGGSNMASTITKIVAASVASRAITKAITPAVTKATEAVTTKAAAAAAEKIGSKTTTKKITKMAPEPEKEDNTLDALTDLLGKLFK